MVSRRVGGREGEEAAGSDTAAASGWRGVGSRKGVGHRLRVSCSVPCPPLWRSEAGPLGRVAGRKTPPKKGCSGCLSRSQLEREVEAGAGWGCGHRVEEEVAEQRPSSGWVGGFSSASIVPQRKEGLREVDPAPCGSDLISPAAYFLTHFPLSLLLVLQASCSFPPQGLCTCCFACLKWLSSFNHSPL